MSGETVIIIVIVGLFLAGAALILGPFPPDEDEDNS